MRTPWSSRRVRTFIPSFCAFAIIVGASLAFGTASSQVRIALLTEESLPSAEMPPSTPMPTASATPSAANGNVTPPAATIAPSPVAAAAPTPETANAGPMEPTPIPSPADTAPLEVGSVQPKPQISDEPLDPYIASARIQSPALAASLRVTEQAREELLSGHEGDAIHELGRAVSIDPSNSYAFFYLGRVWMKRGNYPQAITFFQRAEIGFRSNPEWLGETLAFEGLANEQSGQTAPAIVCYQKAVQSEPGNLMARVGLTRLSGSELPVPSAESGPAPGAPASSMDEPPPPEGAPAAAPYSPPPEPAD